MCRINASNTHHLREYRLIVRRCGKSSYKAFIIDIAVIRIEGPKAPTLQEALEKLFDFTAEQLKAYTKDFEDMGWSHIKGEELRKFEGGGRIAMEKAVGSEGDME